MSVSVKLSALDEVLFRQIHPTFFQNGQPTSQAFFPSSGDAGMMSLDRSSLTTASAAFTLYTSNGNSTAATYGVTVEEFDAEAIPCQSDPLAAAPSKAANPAHALADFNSWPPSKQKTIAKRLKVRAMSRGLLHP